MELRDVLMVVGVLSSVAASSWKFGQDLSKIKESLAALTERMMQFERLERARDDHEKRLREIELTIASLPATKAVVARRRRKTA